MSRIGTVIIVITIVFVFNSANDFAINQEFNSLGGPDIQSDEQLYQRYIYIKPYQSTV